MNIPKENLPRLEAKVAKLTRKATKLGLEPLKLEVIREFQVNFEENLSSDFPPKIVDYVEVTLTSPKIKIEGWEFVAKLEITDSGCIIYNIKPEIEIPEKYREEAGYCDHCKSARYRKDTFLLINEDGEFKQVGRQCLKDFLGYHGTPEHLLSIASIIRHLSVDENYDPFKEFSDSTPGYYRIPALAFLIRAVTAARLYGYKNRQTANEHECASTGDLAWIACTSQHSDNPTRKGITDADKDRAKVIYDWVKSFKGENDYEKNLLTMTEDGLSYHSAGMMASAILSYERDQDNKQKANKLKNEHFGEIKKRSEMNLTFLGESHFDTPYGTMAIMRFRTDNDHLAIWKTTSGWNKDVDVGCSVRVKATVKDHTEYKGFKQTLLTRVTLL